MFTVVPLVNKFMNIFDLWEFIHTYKSNGVG